VIHTGVKSITFNKLKQPLFDINSSVCITINFKEFVQKHDLSFIETISNIISKYVFFLSFSLN